MITMSRTIHTLLAMALAILLLAAIGCEKKAPKNARELSDDESAEQGSAAVEVAEDGTFAVGPLTGTLPENWESRPPASSMRKAEFLIPNPEENGLPGIVAAFYFGPSAGTIEMNIERWVGQFSQPDGQPLSEDAASRETFKAGEMDVVMVSFRGTQKASSMPGGMQMHAMEGWMNVSGIINTPQGPWFFKGTGPEDLMTDQKPAFKSMLESVRFNAE
jgi:hypothetical protein